MANLKISQLPALTAATNNDLLAVVNAGVTKQITVGEFADAIPTFTGNTSATCITTLWVSSISGCSPVIINGLKIDDGTGGDAKGSIVIPNSGVIKLEGTAKIVDSGGDSVVSTISGNISDSSGFGGIVSTDSLDVISDSISVVNSISGTSSATTATTRFVKTTSIGDGLTENAAFNIDNVEVYRRVDLVGGGDIEDLIVQIGGPVPCTCGVCPAGSKCVRTVTPDPDTHNKCSCEAIVQIDGGQSYVSDDGVNAMHDLKSVSIVNNLISTKLFTSNFTSEFISAIKFGTNTLVKSDGYVGDDASRNIFSHELYESSNDGLSLVTTIGGTGGTATTSATSATTVYTKSYGVGDGIQSLDFAYLLNDTKILNTYKSADKDWIGLVAPANSSDWIPEINTQCSALGFCNGSVVNVVSSVSNTTNQGIINIDGYSPILGVSFNVEALSDQSKISTRINNISSVDGLALIQTIGDSGSNLWRSEKFYAPASDVDLIHKVSYSGQSTAFTATTVFITERDIKLATKVDKINNSIRFTIGEDEVKVSGVPLMIGEVLNYKSIGGPGIPVNSQDSVGAIGDLVVDNTALYFKRSSGWVQTIWSTF